MMENRQLLPRKRQEWEGGIIKGDKDTFGVDEYVH